MLTQKRLRTLLLYVPDTGEFIWKVASGGKKVGAVAGSIRKIRSDYQYKRKSINVDGTRYMAHRLAWLYVYGEWPADVIDHINGDPTDNRLTNLRSVSRSENQRNMKKSAANTSGETGVTWDRQHGKWRAQIKTFGKCKFLGLYDSIDEAARVRSKAKQDYHGGFRRGL